MCGSQEGSRGWALGVGATPTGLQTCHSGPIGRDPTATLLPLATCSSWGTGAATFLKDGGEGAEASTLSTLEGIASHSLMQGP